MYVTMPATTTKPQSALMNRGFFFLLKSLYVLPRINTDSKAKQNRPILQFKTKCQYFTIDIDFVTLYCDKVTNIVSCKLSIYIGVADWISSQPFY